MPNITLPLIAVGASAGLSYGYVPLPLISVAATGGMTGNGTTAHNIAVSVQAVAGFSVETQHTILLTPRIAAEAGFSISNNGVVVATTSGIKTALQDIISLFGAACCEKPSDCLLAEAVRAVNTGLQQFYQSAKVHEFLVNPKQYNYDSTDVEGTAEIELLVSASGIDLPSPLSTEVAATPWDIQHISEVSFGIGGGSGSSRILRPVNSSPMAYYGSAAVFNTSEAKEVEWLDAPRSPTPLYYEVFRQPANAPGGAIPKIRVLPWDGVTVNAGTWNVTVTYFRTAAPVTPLDWSNGASFDIATPYVELYLLPLCRYAALSSSYMDDQNAPQVAAVKERYAEVLGFLGLADFQTPTVKT